MKKGDRVIVYGSVSDSTDKFHYLYGEKGMLLDEPSSSQPTIKILLDPKSRTAKGIILAHHKQCRLLKKKEKSTYIIFMNHREFIQLKEKLENSITDIIFESELNKETIKLERVKKKESQ